MSTLGSGVAVGSGRRLLGRRRGRSGLRRRRRLGRRRLRGRRLGSRCLRGRRGGCRRRGFRRRRRRRGCRRRGFRRRRRRRGGLRRRRSRGLRWRGSRGLRWRGSRSRCLRWRRRQRRQRDDGRHGGGRRGRDDRRRRNDRRQRKREPGCRRRRRGRPRRGVLGRSRAGVARGVAGHDRRTDRRRGRRRGVAGDDRRGLRRRRRRAVARGLLDQRARLAMRRPATGRTRRSRSASPTRSGDGARTTSRPPRTTPRAAACPSTTAECGIRMMRRKRPRSRLLSTVRSYTCPSSCSSTARGLRTPRRR